MANFIGLVYATLKNEGIDTKNLSTDEAVEKYNQLQEKSGGKAGANEPTPAENRKLAADGGKDGEDAKSKPIDIVGEYLTPKMDQIREHSKPSEGKKTDVDKYIEHYGYDEDEVYEYINEKHKNTQQTWKEIEEEVKDKMANGEPIGGSKTKAEVLKNDGKELKQYLEGKYGKGELKHLGHYEFSYETDNGTYNIQTAPENDGDDIRIENIREPKQGTPAESNKYTGFDIRSINSFEEGLMSDPGEHGRDQSEQLLIDSYTNEKEKALPELQGKTWQETNEYLKEKRKQLLRDKEKLEADGGLKKHPKETFENRGRLSFYSALDSAVWAQRIKEENGYNDYDKATPAEEARLAARIGGKK